MVTEERTTPAVPPEIKPGFILPILEEEIDLFQERAQRFRIGDEDEEGFRIYRLQHGIYGQRQDDQQMVRVKVPFGGVTAEQMETLARIAEEYSGLGRGHITTRENIQFHFVKLEDAAKAMRRLGRVGLTTREACAHTVRNVTGCAYAGVCPQETFDATPYLVAYARNMLRNPICQALPRKFKTAFSSCPDDCAGTPFHDLGFIARVRSDGNGGLVRGFEIVVGGGTSTMPRRADTIYDFVPVDEGGYIRVSEAILRVFNREGDMPGLLRKNMNKARIKFLLHKIGIDEFRRMVEEELKGTWARKPKEMAALTAMAPEVPTAEAFSPDGQGPLPQEYERWLETNVRAQKQPGYCAVTVTVPMGNLYPQHFRGLARIMRHYGSGHGRVTQNQNLALRWVAQEALPQVYRELVELGLGAPDAGLLADVVSCPGTDSCKLGITGSTQAGYVLRQAMAELGVTDPLAQQVQIKVSGCPNGCGHHHLAAIGLQGASYTIQGHEVPCYDLFLGGSLVNGTIRYGQRVARIAAKKAPQAIAKILAHYQQERQDGESFIEFVDRLGVGSFKPLLEEFKEVGPLHLDIDSYLDWGSEELFQMVRGEGECAAGDVPKIQQ